MSWILLIILLCCPCSFLKVCLLIQVPWHLIPPQLWLRKKKKLYITILLNLHGCAKIRGSPPISAIKLPWSHPCKCVRWPCSLSRLSDERCAAFEGRAQLRLCPVHVWGALLLMSESLCLCFSSPTLSHLPFSSGSVETALFRLSLTGSPQTCCFPALPPHLPHISLSQLTHTHIHTRLTGRQQQQDNGLSGLLCCVQCSGNKAWD